MNFWPNLPVSQIASAPKQIFKAFTSTHLEHPSEPPAPAPTNSNLDTKSWCARFLEPINSPLMPRANLMSVDFLSSPLVSPPICFQPAPPQPNQALSKLARKFCPRPHQSPFVPTTSIQFMNFSSIACRRPSMTYKTGGKLRRYDNFRDRIFNKFSVFCKKYVDLISPDSSPLKMHVIIDQYVPGMTKLELHPIAVKKPAQIVPMKQVSCFKEKKLLKQNCQRSFEDICSRPSSYKEDSLFGLVDLGNSRRAKVEKPSKQ